MAKSKSKSRSKSSKPSPAQQFAIRVGLWIAVLGMLFLAAGMAGRNVWRRLTHHPAFVAHPATDFEVAQWPEWVREDAMRAELSRAISERTPEAVSLFHPHGPAPDNLPEELAATSVPNMVRDALLDCPWLAGVNAVRKRLPDGLLLDVAFRKPAGVVSWLGERHLVDADGHWLKPEGVLFTLPAEYAGDTVPLIREDLLSVRPDVMEANPASELWPAARLAVGARLHLFFLEEAAYDWLPLREINVTWVERRAGQTILANGLTQPQVTLVTEGGTEVQWGKSSAYSEIPGITELPPRDTDLEKLRRLKALGAREPGLLMRPGVVDVRTRAAAVRPAP